MTSTRSRAAHVAVYRALSRLTPRSHRTRFREDQCRLFADLLANGVAPHRLWSRALPDLVTVWWHTAPAPVSGLARLAATPHARLPATPVATRRTLPRRRAELTGASWRMLAVLAGGSPVHGRDLAAEASSGAGADDAWQALVDLVDTGLVVDEPLWGWAPVGWRMRARYTITPAGLRALEDHLAGPAG